ncbi:hypothetical protein ACI6Q2_18280 [Chitinophagaceae bacterium LWZ2-11]
MKKKPIPSTKVAKKIAPQKKDLLQIIEFFFEKNQILFFGIFLGLTFIIGLLLYAPQASIAGDDSGYILRAYNFAHHFSYPGDGGQGPLYPMAMSWITLITGTAFFPLKMFSLACMLGCVTLTFFSFRNRIPSTVLMFTLLFTSINSAILYYASQTFSEAFYMLIQMLSILLFCKYFISKNTETPDSLLPALKKNTLLALTLLALCLTRSVGYSMIIAMLFYLILDKQWRNTLLLCSTFLILYTLFNILKEAIWHNNASQFSEQVSGALNKNSYHSEYGRETFSGLLNRLVQNSKTYFSVFFYQINGFGSIEKPLEASGFRALLTCSVALLALLISFKKNKYLFFSGLVVGAACLMSFLALPESWSQDRIIIPFISLIGMVLAGGLFYWAMFKKMKFLQYLLPVLVIIICWNMLGKTADKIQEARNFEDEYSGFTPDWEHYLRASKWAADSLPQNSFTACRKASLSSVYGDGKPFYFIPIVPSGSVAAFLENWQKKNINYAFFSIDIIMSRPIPPYAFSLLKKNLLARMIFEDAGKANGYLIVPLQKQEKDTLDHTCNLLSYPYISSIDTISKMVQKYAAHTSLIYPDSLAIPLKQNKVTHVITAQLRAGSNNNSDNLTMNTVELYMGYINDKYPGFLTPVKTIGTSNNESATVNKINWERYPNIGLPASNNN